MNDFIFRNIDGKENKVSYKIFSSTKKVGKNSVNTNDVVFYTDPADDDDSLRHIEDICELVVEKNKLGYTTTSFYEMRGEVLEIIELSWDQKRYRGCNRIEESHFKKEEHIQAFQKLKEKFKAN